jgi:hypothetical protein
MKLVITSFLLTLILSLQAQKVEKSALAIAADLSKYKTYGFFDIDTSGLINKDNFVKNLQLLKQAVSTEMKSRGYEESANPELKINMGVVIVEKTQTRETDFRTDRPRYMGQRNYSWQSEEVVVGVYREGTLDFHLVDASNNQMVWWATVTDVLPEKQKNISKTVEKSVKKMFGKYPVKAN